MTVLAAAALAATTSAGAAVEGRVVTPGSTPVEGARVELTDGSDFQLTDARGRFRFPDLETPVELRVVHPRFQILETRCCDDPAAPLVLVPKMEVFGEIVVTAEKAMTAS